MTEVGRLVYHKTFEFPSHICKGHGLDEPIFLWNRTKSSHSHWSKEGATKDQGEFKDQAPNQVPY